MRRNPYHPSMFPFFLSIFLTFSLMSYAQAEQTSLAELQTKSANGDKESQNLLGVKYFTGNEVNKNELKAAELFTRAARQGLAKAQFNLGYMYHQGKGLTQDYMQACLWYKAAADQGHSEAAASYNSLEPYLDDAKREKIAHLSTQIPAHSVANTNERPSSSSSDPVRLGDWIRSVQPAAGK